MAGLLSFWITLRWTAVDAFACPRSRTVCVRLLEAHRRIKRRRR